MDPGRTVVVSGVPDVLSVSRMIDKLTIHFQRRRRSDGGDVEVVRYPANTDGVAFVTFDKAEDAARVVQKEEQIMTDEEFPADYILTVFPFTRDVFLYVPRALVDLSVFGSDQESLIQSLRSAHRSLRFRPLLQQRKATIEGPFTAVQRLREDLIRRAGRLKSSDSAQTAAVKIRESPLNPRVISQREFANSVSCGRSKAKLEPANSLSTPEQTTGDAAGVKSLLSNVKTQIASSRPKGLAEGSFCNTDSDDSDEHGSRNRSQNLTESRREREKSESRQVIKEINAGIKSSLWGLSAAEDMSAKEKQQENDISRKITGPDRISASKKQKENHSSSCRTDLWNSSESKSEDTGEHPKQTCIWVDSHAFRYMQKFNRQELDKCLRGLRASVVRVKGSDLVRVILTEKRTSKATSEIQQALENLQALLESWVTTLRVHEIHLDEERPQKQEVIQICDDVSFLFDDVLYMLEGSCIKVVGPPSSSHLFNKMAKKRISELRDKSM